MADQPGQRPTHRVAAGSAQTRGQLQQRLMLRERCFNGLQAQRAVGQGAGFIHHQGGQVGQLFKERRAANQDPVTRCHGDPGNRGGRCRQHQRTRARRHQHREHGLGIVGDKPGHGGDHQHQHHVAARIAFEQTGDRRLGALGVLHQGNDFAQRRLFTRACHLNAQQTVQIDRATVNGHAHADFQRHRLPGDRRRVETGLARQHHTIGRHAIPGAHFNLVPGLERAVVDFQQTAVGLK